MEKDSKESTDDLEREIKKLVEAKKNENRVLKKILDGLELINKKETNDKKNNH